MLKKIALDWLRFDVLPNLVAMWSAARKAPQKAADAPKASPAVQVPAEPENAPAVPPLPVLHPACGLRRGAPGAWYRSPGA